MLRNGLELFRFLATTPKALGMVATDILVRILLLSVWWVKRPIIRKALVFLVLHLGLQFPNTFNVRTARHWRSLLKLMGMLH
jgi:negative regulator of replication initiation